MSNSAFESKRAIVTGAASGIGLEIARQLVERGARVVGADIDKDALGAAAGALGDGFVPVHTDVTDEGSVRAAVATAVDRFGGLDLAYNVAGATRPAPILDMDEAGWDFTVDLVQKGVFFSVKHEAKAMIDAQVRGSIVNISSLNAHVPMPMGSAYATAKAGVEMFSKNAALELGHYGIRVNAVLPGLVATPMTAPLLGVETIAADFLGRIPLGRPATVADIAGPCLFLGTEEAAYITGTSLMVDGGWEITNYPDLRRYFG